MNNQTGILKQRIEIVAVGRHVRQQPLKGVGGEQ